MTATGCPRTTRHRLAPLPLIAGRVLRIGTDLWPGDPYAQGFGVITKVSSLRVPYSAVDLQYEIPCIVVGQLYETI